MRNIFKKTETLIKLFLIAGACYLQGLQADVSECNLLPCGPTPSCGRGFVSADFLYWRAFEGGLAECLPCEEVNCLNDEMVFSEVRGEKKDLHYKWKPGIRLGAGYHSSNNWDVAAYWTDFRSDARGDHSYAQPSQWKLDFQVVDLLVGYKLDVYPCCLTLRPFAGVRLAEIDQSLKACHSNLCSRTAFKEHRKQDFSGIGPLFGIGANLNLACGLSLYADVAGSVLYGNYRANSKKADLFLGAGSLSRFKQHLHACQAVFDAAFGISWETCFYNELQLIFRLGVEHHCYFDHNRMGDYGNLNLDGGSFSATVIF